MDKFIFYLFSPLNQLFNVRAVLFVSVSLGSVSMKHKADTNKQMFTRHLYREQEALSTACEEFWHDLIAYLRAGLCYVTPISYTSVCSQGYSTNWEWKKIGIQY